jgi:hypothetical protein
VSDLLGLTLPRGAQWMQIALAPQRAEPAGDVDLRGKIPAQEGFGECVSHVAILSQGAPPRAYELRGEGSAGVRDEQSCGR